MTESVCDRGRAGGQTTQNESLCIHVYVVTTLNCLHVNVNAGIQCVTLLKQMQSSELSVHVNGI